MKNDKVVIGYNERDGIYALTERGSFEPFVIERGGPEKVARFSFMSRQLRWLQGEILTVAEAVIDDPRKLEATKALIKDRFSAKISWIYELCGTPEDEQRALDLD